MDKFSVHGITIFREEALERKIKDPVGSLKRQIIFTDVEVKNPIKHCIHLTPDNSIGN